MRKENTSSHDADAGTISRRYFLQQTGGLTFCFAFARLFGDGDTYAAGTVPHQKPQLIEFNAYVHISPDGTVTIINPAAEMGQGVMTALPVIVAEELDVEWDDVRIESSPPIGEVYGDPLFFNRIFTTSSRAVTNYYQRLRRFGREARQVLLENAAGKWGVPVAELRTAPSLVIHDKSGRSISYGEIAGFADTSSTFHSYGDRIDWFQSQGRLPAGGHSHPPPGPSRESHRRNAIQHGCPACRYGLTLRYPGRLLKAPHYAPSMSRTRAASTVLST